MRILEFAALSGALMLIACHDLDAVPRLDASTPDVRALDGGDDVRVPDDTGNAGDDSSVPDDTGNDSSAPDDAGNDSSVVLCIPEPLAAIRPGSLPRCSSVTSSCVVGCGGSACINTCLEADSTPASDGLDCAQCFVIHGASCAYRRGCEGAFDALDCCRQANTCTDPICVESCGAEVRAAQDCVSDQFAACEGTLAACFAVDT